MIVLSLFDGMSCGQIALKELGIKVDTYYASEIKESAIYVTQLNFPETIQLGDVLNWRNWDIDFSRVDLILAGSPCQDFSILNKKRDRLKGSKSKLFYTFLEIRNHIMEKNPNVKWVLENVTSGTFAITSILRCNPIFITNREFSWCNRNRYFWTNINSLLFNDLFGDDFIIPKTRDSFVDKGIRFKEIIKSDEDIRTISKKRIDGFHRQLAKGFKFNDVKEKGTGICITTRTNGGTTNIVRNSDTNWRFLTKWELMDANGIPEWYTFGKMKYTGVYNLIGDGWSIGSAKYILKHLKNIKK